MVPLLPFLLFWPATTVKMNFYFDLSNLCMRLGQLYPLTPNLTPFECLLFELWPVTPVLSKNKMPKFWILAQFDSDKNEYGKKILRLDPKKAKVHVNDMTRP
jgi:hypothetical protein